LTQIKVLGRTYSFESVEFYLQRLRRQQHADS